jgi:hypothetical protein
LIFIEFSGALHLSSIVSDIRHLINIIFLSSSLDYSKDWTVVTVLTILFNLQSSNASSQRYRTLDSIEAQVELGSNNAIVEVDDEWTHVLMVPNLMEGTPAPSTVPGVA